MITQERLKELLTYYPKSGRFRWNINRPRVKKGQLAGTILDGYIVIKLDQQPYKAHRLVFLYMLGKWPENEIDHINGKGIDNRWKNLRDVTRRENRCNTHYTFNESGYVGVCYRPEVSIYNPYQVAFDNTYLGSYSTAEKANEIYQQAKTEFWQNREEL